MDTTLGATDVATDEISVANVDMKLEVVVIPVSDVDRARAFYECLGWRLDAEFPFDNGMRIVQFTPLGSTGSIQWAANTTRSGRPGTPRTWWRSKLGRDCRREHKQRDTKGSP